MSSQSSQEKASGEFARTQAALQGQLYGIAGPELRQLLGMVNDELGAGSARTDAIFDQARSGLNSDYAQAGRSSQTAIGQQLLQSGAVAPQGFAEAAYAPIGQALEQDHAQANRRLNFQQAQAGLEQYNTLLGLLGQGTNRALQLGGAYSGLQGQAIGMMPRTSQLGGTLGGLASGASAGSAINFPYGTIIGGLVGAGTGYFGSQP